MVYFIRLQDNIFMNITDFLQNTSNTDITRLNRLFHLLVCILDKNKQNLMASFNTGGLIPLSNQDVINLIDEHKTPVYLYIANGKPIQGCRICVYSYAVYVAEYKKPDLVFGYKDYDVTRPHTGFLPDKLFETYDQSKTYHDMQWWAVNVPSYNSNWNEITKIVLNKSNHEIFRDEFIVYMNNTCDPDTSYKYMLAVLNRFGHVEIPEWFIKYFKY